MNVETLVDGPLTLRLADLPDEVRLEWTGESTAREPGPYLLPILIRTLDHGLKARKLVVLDFTRLGYCNSSTLTPIIRILEYARRGSHRVTILYDSALKWQALSFTALTFFRTADGRISIRGI